jgi:hypothetical protein
MPWPAWPWPSAGPATASRSSTQDQGRSGQTAAGRLGFPYVLAELGLDHAGIVLGLGASRLARSDPDWAPPVRRCGVSPAPPCGHDGLYGPADLNDRLILGLK